MDHTLTPSDCTDHGTLFGAIAPKEQPESQPFKRPESQPFKRPESQPVKRPESQPEYSPPQQLRLYFEAEWKRRNGADYYWQAAKDMQAAKSVLSACKGSIDLAKRMIDLYLDDGAPFVVSLGHPMAILRTRLNAYLTKLSSPAEPADQFTEDDRRDRQEARDAIAAMQARIAARMQELRDRHQRRGAA